MTLFLSLMTFLCLGSAEKHNSQESETKLRQELDSLELEATSIASRFLRATKIHDINYTKVMNNLYVPFDDKSTCYGSASFAIEYALIERFSLWLRLNKALKNKKKNKKKNKRERLKSVAELTSKKMLRYSADQNFLRTYTETETTENNPFAKTVMFLNDSQHETKLKEFLQALIDCKEPIHFLISFKGHSMALIKEEESTVVLVNSGCAHRTNNPALLALVLRKLLLQQFRNTNQQEEIDYVTQLESFTFAKGSEIKKVHQAMDNLYKPSDRSQFLDSKQTNHWNLQHVNIKGLEFLGYTREDIARAYGLNLMKRIEEGKENI